VLTQKSLGHGSRRGFKPGMTVLAKASGNLFGFKTDDLVWEKKKCCEIDRNENPSGLIDDIPGRIFYGRLWLKKDCLPMMMIHIITSYVIHI
jgi:hypothetical protein